MKIDCCLIMKSKMTKLCFLVVGGWGENLRLFYLPSTNEKLQEVDSWLCYILTNLYVHANLKIHTHTNIYLAYFATNEKEQEVHSWLSHILTNLYIPATLKTHTQTQKYIFHKWKGASGNLWLLYIQVTLFTKSIFCFSFFSFGGLLTFCYPVAQGVTWQAFSLSGVA